MEYDKQQQDLLERFADELSGSAKYAARLNDQVSVTDLLAHAKECLLTYAVELGAFASDGTLLSADSTDPNVKAKVRRALNCDLLDYLDAERRGRGEPPFVATSEPKYAVPAPVKQKTGRKKVEGTVTEEQYRDGIRPAEHFGSMDWQEAGNEYVVSLDANMDAAQDIRYHETAASNPAESSPKMSDWLANEFSILCLHYVNGFSESQIGHILGIDQATAHRRIVRERERFIKWAVETGRVEQGVALSVLLHSVKSAEGAPE